MNINFLQSERFCPSLKKRLGDWLKQKRFQLLEEVINPRPIDVLKGVAIKASIATMLGSIGLSPTLTVVAIVLGTGLVAAVLSQTKSPLIFSACLSIGILVG